mmetsp:Transcript_1457/g.3407  ORF Transcript_1457/g.3407 Transcript_1457/m.3407 type:complete len:210 (+) Transcript_1457:196-825(+)
MRHTGQSMQVQQRSGFSQGLQRPSKKTLPLAALLLALSSCLNSVRSFCNSMSIPASVTKFFFMSFKSAFKLPFFSSCFGDTGGLPFSLSFSLPFLSFLSFFFSAPRGLWPSFLRTPPGSMSFTQRRSSSSCASSSASNAASTAASPSTSADNTDCHKDSPSLSNHLPFITGKIRSRSSANRSLWNIHQKRYWKAKSKTQTTMPKIVPPW